MLMYAINLPALSGRPPALIRATPSRPDCYPLTSLAHEEWLWPGDRPGASVGSHIPVVYCAIRSWVVRHGPIPGGLLDSHNEVYGRKVLPVFYLASAVDFAPRELAARVVDWRATESTREPVDCRGVTLGSLDCVEAIVTDCPVLFTQLNTSRAPEP